jgi:thiamine biosynthesis lipoprotein ApbE
MEDIWNSVSSPIQITIICVGILLFLTCIALLSKPAPISIELKEIIQQAAQFHEKSLQDTDAAIALQHSTQALAYVAFARRLAADAVIEKSTNIKIKELESILIQTQAKHVSKLSSREATISAIAAGYVEKI